MKYLVNHFLALIMQLKVKVTPKGQGHVHLTTKQDTIALILCTMNAWAYFTAYGTIHIVSYGGKGYKSI